MTSKSQQIIRLVCEVALFFVGTTLVGIFDSNEVISKIGYSLITSSLTAFIFELILKNDFIERIEKHLKSQDSLIENVEKHLNSAIQLLPERRKLTDRYKKIYTESKEIKIIALTAEKIIDYSGDLILSQIKEKEVDIEILILNPKSKMWDVRINHEPSHDRAALENIQAKNEKWFKEFAEKMAKEKDIKGYIHVKYYDSIPYFSLCKGDDSVVFGFLTSNSVGERSHAFLSKDKDSKLYQDLIKHFQSQWKDSKNKDLLMVSPRESMFYDDNAKFLGKK